MPAQALAAYYITHKLKDELANYCVRHCGFAVGAALDKVIHRPRTAVRQLVLELVRSQLRCNALIGRGKFCYARYPQAL